MKVTNRMNLPKAFVKAVTTEKHNADGSYSATTLLKGTCETILSKRHWDEITVDAADSIWTVWGTAVHAIFEKIEDEGFKEEFFSTKISNSIITGRIDYYNMDKQELCDYKTASTWKIQFNDFSDWYKQGMIYAYLMNKAGLNVKRCRFIALLKDHSKSKARTDSAYPQSPVYIYQFDVTADALKDIEIYINSRVAELEAAELKKDEELQPCSKEERWASDDKYAVMKSGRKSAIKVFDTEEEAKAKLEELKGEYVEHRPGESRKCADYCNVCKWCPFCNSRTEK